MPTRSKFELFTSIRYDPQLRENPSNGAFAGNTPSPFYMLSLHRDRIAEAAKYFGWTAVQTALGEFTEFRRLLEEKVEEQKRQHSLEEEKPLKVRILFNEQGQMDVDCAVVPLTSKLNLYPVSLDVPGMKPPPLFRPSPLTGGALHSAIGNEDSINASQVKPTYVVILDTQATEVNAHLSLKTTFRDHYDESRQRTLASLKEIAGLRNKEVILYNTDKNIMEGSLTTAYFHRNGKWVTPPLNLDHGGQMGTTRRWALAEGLCIEEEVGLDSVRPGEKIWLSNGVRGFQWGFVYDLDELRQI